ncbi:MAG: MoaD/ThiS family protein [Pseudomonadota bacterium]
MGAQSISVTVRFFASLREATGTEALELSLAGGHLSALREALIERLGVEACEPLWAENVRVAVNQSIVPGAPSFAHGDEVAFLPPVTGG